ncbi:phage portal protein [Enterococcus devriesei]|uniref:PBSX family phage portal protein n=1 Tax=Enterococcus devriesei TaxID=319970 RepID=A0A1L8SNW3_9ENTE|nr:phage portal protein [Enterococcus devriesei]OJG33756.1 PBSX family phage portal protein [Enterococcus devriesei]
MTSKVISGGRNGTVPEKFQVKDVHIAKERTLKYNSKGGAKEIRDLSLLSPPYDVTMLRSIPDISDILNQCIEAYVTNVVGFGMGIRYKVDDLDETEEMKTEWNQLESIVAELSFERPAKEVIEEVIRHVEECGNGYFEVIRNLKGEVVGIDSIKPEFISVTKLNRVQSKDGQEIKVRYFCFQDATMDSTIENGTWYKTYGDPTPLNKNGSVSSEGNGTATEVMHLKIGDFQEPYGVPRWIGPLIKILGNRKADELNYRYFTQGRHIPLAILLENAQLTEASEASLQNYANGIGSEGESQHKFLVIEAEKMGPTDDMLFDENKDKPAIKLEKLSDILQQDALFLEYDKNVIDAVLGAFRLPPIYVARSSDYTRATAETAKELTEEQVFQPQRESYSWRINSLFREYDFKYVEVFFKSSNIVNMEDIKAILDPAIQANAVAPNDLRDIVSKVLAKPLEPFDGEQYNYPNGSVQADQGMIPNALSTNADFENAQLEPGETNQLGQTVQQVSLNGAQITSLVNIVQAVASGKLPRSSALEMITAAFPFDEEKAKQILGDSNFVIADESIQKAYGQNSTSDLAATVRRLIKEVRSRDD